MGLLMEEDEEDTEDSIPSGLLLEWLWLLLLMVEGGKKSVTRSLSDPCFLRNTPRSHVMHPHA
jgi:hypothetical protein